MNFKTFSGSSRSIPRVKNYLIDWDSKSRSKFQNNVKTFLYSFWENHVVFEEMPVPGTKLSLDFYNANKKIAIEVQGDQHVKYVPFFHGAYKNNYLSQLDRDQKKEEFCNLNGIHLVEIFSNDPINKTFFKSQGVLL